ncbi:DUF3014 domain-containing protein [Nevskia soli]|uniref:DUF3014 domain-containing protein n=1 Tax=Nevskia soli TaxID=418856 RepID=UPI0004A700F8|nr:DUF3014 domain-containing protein [Nevskia soli]
MKKSIWPVLIVILVAAVGGIAYYLHTQRTEPPPVAAVQPAPEAPPPAPQSHYPIEEEPVAAPTPPKPLPGLDESDAEAQASLGGVFGQQTLVDLFQLKGIIRRIVATIDNLPRDKVAGRLLAVKPVPGHFTVDGAEGSRSIAAENYARYTPYVHAAQVVDAKKLVSVYVHLYPLFQQTYVSLGYPDGYFNDRLVQVIDNLLAAPTPAAPVRLDQPNVLFTYADPELEALSAGQKMLVRMGPANEAIVKDKLRQIRIEVTSRVHKP